MKRQGGVNVVVLCGIVMMTAAGSLLAAEATEPRRQPNAPMSDEVLALSLREAHKLYGARYRSLEREVSQLFGMPPTALKEKLDSTMREFEWKSSLIMKIDDLPERARRLRALEAEYDDEQLPRTMEAYYYLQNELFKDHRFVGRWLAILQESLDVVIRKDPVLRYAFNSRTFRARYGRVLTRVVADARLAPNLSAETVPLDVSPVFADKAKAPMLIKLTPRAFQSLAWLRSMLIHELNHVYLHKDRRLIDRRAFSGPAMKPPQGRVSQYFKFLNPRHPSYQYHLLHEYYSLKAQLEFDEVVPPSPYFRLDPRSRKHVEQLLEWTVGQLHEHNASFVAANPHPPVLELIERFYGSQEAP